MQAPDDSALLTAPFGGGAHGRVVAVVGAHGGAGTTAAVEELEQTLPGPLCVIDADLAGGDVAGRLGLKLQQGDAGLAALEGVGDPLAALAHPIARGFLVAVCPRPELAWLIGDDAARELCRSARRHAPIVLVDAGRIIGPVHEVVAEADLVVLVAAPGREFEREQTRRRLARLGVSADRVVDHRPTPRTLVGTTLRLLRGDGDTVDELALLVEGRLASVATGARA